MNYTFETLSHADFEDLTRELLGRALDIRFETFAQGPDGGMDGRHAVGSTTVILQAKHYRSSSFPALLATMKKERASIDKLGPSRYILATSRNLTPLQKSKLAGAIGPHLKAESDIFDAGDLNQLLRRFPSIERAHIKLWLSSSTVLDRVIKSASHAFNDITRFDIEKKVKVYAQNASFEHAQHKLETSGVLIVSGPPGVGKTTLAEMLAFGYIAEGWNLISIRGLEDGFARINDHEKQIFFFDDFLGKIALDERALSNQDSQLSTFLSRVRRSPNSRFILTTRAYIFEEARRVSEHLADKRLDISKYVLDVSVYTRSVRARILYNHLVSNKVPSEFLATLVDQETLKIIVDHDNYNPRVIEWMTDPTRTATVSAEKYADFFKESLDNPSDIWDTAFRRHISTACQNLLITLYFFEEWGVSISKLRAAFEPLHEVMSKVYGTKRSAKDFEDSLRTLEGSFISISDTRVDFINSSVRDYLTTYVSDKSLLTTVAKGATFVRWAERVEDQFEAAELSGVDELVAGFGPLARRLTSTPIKPFSFADDDLEDVTNGSKLRAAVHWWYQTGDKVFLELAHHVASADAKMFWPWRDGTLILETASALHHSEQKSLFELVDGLAIQLMRSHLDLDDLHKMLEVLDEKRDEFSVELRSAADEAVRNALEDLPTMVNHVDSESTLEDYLLSLDELARRVSASTVVVERAKRALDERIMVVRDTSDDGWSFDGHADDEEQFTDKQLMDLFAPLLN